MKELLEEKSTLMIRDTRTRHEFSCACVSAIKVNLVETAKSGQGILVVTSHGLAAPSLAVLGPRGVALLLLACPAPFRSHGFAGALLPAV